MSQRLLTGFGIGEVVTQKYFDVYGLFSLSVHWKILDIDRIITTEYLSITNERLQNVPDITE